MTLPPHLPRSIHRALMSPRPASLAVAAALALGVAGCQVAPPSAAPVQGKVSGTLKVALLTSGAVNDQGWNQLGFTALQGLKQAGDATTSQVVPTASGRIPALRDLAAQGTNLLLLHGFEFGDAAKTVAPAFPNTKFVVVAGNVTQAPNVATLIPKLEDATYLLGIIAGGMTRTGKIGLLGGEDAPEIRSPFAAFAAGVKSINPRAQVLPTVFVGWDDQTKGKEASQALLADGADILFHNADQAGKGMFAAAEAARAQGLRVWVFGSNADQNHVAPNITLASAVIDLPLAFSDAAHSVQAGTFAPRFIELNGRNGRIQLVWNPSLKSQVPASVQAAVAKAAAAIANGTLKIKRMV